MLILMHAGQTIASWLKDPTESVSFSHFSYLAYKLPENFLKFVCVFCRHFAPRHSGMKQLHNPISFELIQIVDSTEGVFVFFSIGF